MTANTTDIYSGDLRPENSDELDLRRYLLVVFRWWREIFTIALLVGAITGITLTMMNRNETPMYAASADVLMARLSTTIELDNRVSTLLNMGQADPNGWRASLVQLAKSSVVAEAVVAELGDDLPAAYRNPDLLSALIQPSIPLSPDERFASNLIRLTVTTDNAERSSMIVNSWALHLVDFINGLYGEVPESTIANVTIEREEAFAEYQTAQSAVEEFMATSQLGSLARQIQEKTALRDSLLTNFTSLQTAIVSTEYAAGINLYNAMANAASQHATALISTQSAGTIQSLTRLYNVHASLVTHLNQARLMENTLVAGGEAAASSNVAALHMLKLATFATMYTGEQPSANFDLTGEAMASQMTLEEQLTDVRALVSSLEEYIARLEGEITTMSTTGVIGAGLEAIAGLDTAPATDPLGEGEAGETVPNFSAPYAQLLGPEGVLDQAPAAAQAMVSEAHDQLLDELDTELRALQAAVAAEEALQRQLIHRRDLAWTTYETVGTKLQELRLLRSSANTELRVGDFATVPNAPVPKESPLLMIVAITLVAFGGAVVLALLVDSFGGGPFFARRPSRTSFAS